MEAQVVKNKQVAIVGSGFIGSSWAMLFTGAGYSVTLYDVEPKMLEVALDRIKSQLLKLEKLGLRRSSLQMDKQLSLVTVTTDITKCLKDAFYVQECVYEKADVKKAAFEIIDKHVGDDTILASSVSATLPSLFASSLKHRSNFVVAHPCNPPFYCPLVELVGIQWTKPEIIDKTEAIMKELGQVTVRVKKEVDGFALNRLQYALMAEAFRLVQDDIISIEDVDKIMKHGLGMRYAFMGPFETIHLNAKGIEEYAEKYNKIFTDTCASMGPIPSMTGPLLEKMAAEMNSKIPIEDVGKRIEWRDNCLAALAKTKKELFAQQGE